MYTLLLLFTALISSSIREKLIKEVSIMISFDHPNVMSMIGICFDGQMPLLILPYMSEGSVLDYVKRHKEDLYISDYSPEIQV